MKAFPEIPKCELFLAGGFVRDHILGLTPDDRDFVVITELTFEELVKECEKLGKVFLVKPEFLTIRCMIDKEVIDLVLPRTETDYLDNRHPDTVNRVGSLREDSCRRDFTINAMYMDKNNNIIDYHDGEKDLKNKILRCVGNPENRFKEDPLRILRGLRFKSKLNLEIDELTFDSMYERARSIITISMDRIKDEINKMLKLSPVVTIADLSSFKVMDIIKNKGLHFELSAKKIR